MKYQLELFRQNRKNIISLLEEHTLEQVNMILPASRNNLIWNAGHLLVSQQFLWYHFSGLELQVGEDLIGKYAENSVPSGQATRKEFDNIKSLLQSSTDKSIADYHDNRFKSYNAYASDYFGLTMNSIDEAIQFNNYHEGVHFGHMAQFRRRLKTV